VAERESGRSQGISISEQKISFKDILSKTVGNKKSNKDDD
jgi:hypothetical protein